MDVEIEDGIAAESERIKEGDGGNGKCEERCD